LLLVVALTLSALAGQIWKTNKAKLATKTFRVIFCMLFSAISIDKRKFARRAGSRKEIGCQILHIDPRFQSCGKQIEAAKFAVQKNCVGRWGVPESRSMLNARPASRMRAARSDAKVVVAGMAQGFASQDKQIKDKLPLRLCNVA